MFTTFRLEMRKKFYGTNPDVEFDWFCYDKASDPFNIHIMFKVLNDEGNYITQQKLLDINEFCEHFKGFSVEKDDYSDNLGIRSESLYYDGSEIYYMIEVTSKLQLHSESGTFTI